MTSDEYVTLSIGFFLVVALLALVITSLVRRFGWNRDAREWRLNRVGVVLPWIGGLMVVFGVFYLRGY